MHNEGVLIDKLNILIKLTAANAIKDKDFKEQVRLLSSVGLQPKEIADILGKNPNHISVTLFSLRKIKSKSKENTKIGGVDGNGQEGSE